jgi:hypothetical protein
MTGMIAYPFTCVYDESAILDITGNGLVVSCPEPYSDVIVCAFHSIPGMEVNRSPLRKSHILPSSSNAVEVRPETVRLLKENTTAVTSFAVIRARGAAVKIWDLASTYNIRMKPTLSYGGKRASYILPCIICE